MPLGSHFPDLVHILILPTSWWWGNIIYWELGKHQRLTYQVTKNVFSHKLGASSGIET
jgi:hypothetical protein